MMMTAAAFSVISQRPCVFSFSFFFLPPSSFCSCGSSIHLKRSQLSAKKTFKLIPFLFFCGTGRRDVPPSSSLAVYCKRLRRMKRLFRENKTRHTWWITSIVSSPFFNDQWMTMWWRTQMQGPINIPRGGWRRRPWRVHCVPFTNPIGRRYSNQ